MMLNIQGRVFGLKTVSNQPGDEIDQEVERAAMAGMLNLGNIFELVVDSLDDGAFA